MGRSRNQSRSNTKRRDQNTPEFYAEGDFFGLTFSNNVQDLIDFDRPINFNPDISLIENNSKAVFNFTGCADRLEKNYIDRVINGISLTDGFTLSQAQHFDSYSNEISDLSGFYTCAATFDKVIVTNVSSVERAQNYNKTYKGSDFESDIVTDFSGLSKTDSSEENSIKNLFGRTISPSFDHFGVRPGDFVRILDGQNINKYFEITSMDIDRNDHETLFFGASADFIDESRFNSKTKLRFYRTGDSGSSGETRVNYSGAVVVITPTMTGSNATDPGIISGGFVLSSYQQPTITLSVGSTYIFNLSNDDLDTNNLVFRISTTEDGIWNGGAPHPDVKLCGDVLVFYPEVAGTYYYYSEKRPNSGGKILVFQTDPEIFNGEPFGFGLSSLPQSSSNIIESIPTATNTIYY